MILMLEDNAERVERFTRTLTRFDPPPELRIWRCAWTMIREAEPLLSQTRLISLDHDLDPIDEQSPDPGTGWDFTKWLAARSPVCPVIVHTSNTDRGNWMMGEFELGRWKHHRIAPIGDDWIEYDRRRLVRRLMRLKKSPR